MLHIIGVYVYYESLLWNGYLEHSFWSSILVLFEVMIITFMFIFFLNWWLCFMFYGTRDITLVYITNSFLIKCSNFFMLLLYLHNNCIILLCICIPYWLLTMFLFWFCIFVLFDLMSERIMLVLWTCNLMFEWWEAMMMF